MQIQKRKADIKIIIIIIRIIKMIIENMSQKNFIIVKAIKIMMEI
jgi:hypothetical protein